MRDLQAVQLRDIARGAAILGSGGGGDPHLGALAELQALDEYGPATLISADAVPEHGLVLSAIMVGAPVPLVEKLSFGDELVTAYETVTELLNAPIVALMSPEVGGINSILPISLGSRLNLPVADADAMGRAYPELQLVTLTLFGISASPFALADEHGNRLTIDAGDNLWVERIARAVVVEFGAICPGVGYAMSGKQLRAAAVLGSISHAERIGCAIRQAHGGDAAIDAVLRLTRGMVLFQGKIADLDRQTQRGWSVGQAALEGTGPDRGARMTVSFQNENLVAHRDGLVVATVPDLVTILDQESGEAITTEHLRYGLRVIVIGMPCDAKWRSAAGIALGGPRHFGYDIDYQPVEHLAACQPAPGTPTPGISHACR
jgi:DUF917 family protein